MNGLRKIELHWETRNEYVLTANELKSLEEKHRRELERRKKEEEEKKKKIGGVVSDLQNHGGISQNFVAHKVISRPSDSLNKSDNSLRALHVNKPVSVENINLKNRL